MKKKYYKFVELPGFDEDVLAIKEYVLTNYGEVTEFYNKMDTALFKIICPERLYKNIIKLCGKIDRVLVFKIDEFNKHKLLDGGIHIDSGKATHRLNLPILNGASIKTIFFSLIDESKIQFKVVNSNEKAAVAHMIERANCIEKDSYVLNSPLILNVKEPHGLYIQENKFPRYILSIQFVSNTLISNLMQD